MNRLVVVADNPLIVGAIRCGLRDTGAFELLGYVDPREASASRIVQAGAGVVLVDEAADCDPPIELIRSLRELDPDIPIIVLALQIEGNWVDRALTAGANGAMSKAIHPSALATLVRAAIRGHIVHSPARIRAATRATLGLATEHSSLTGREFEILRFLASGATNAEIARKLWIAQQTVKFHVSNIYRKLDVANRTEACHYAHVNGLVAPEESLSATGPTDEVLAIAS